MTAARTSSVDDLGILLAFDHRFVDMNVFSHHVVPKTDWVAEGRHSRLYRPVHRESQKVRKTTFPAFSALISSMISVNIQLALASQLKRSPLLVA